MSDSEPDNAKPPLATGTLTVTDLLGIGAATKNLGPAATEVIRALAGALGKAYEPASIYLSTRAKSAADRHNALADIKAYQTIETGDDAIAEAMRRRILGIEYQRQVNITEAERAAVFIAGRDAPEGGVQPIAADFVLEWIEGVKDITDESVRDLWARLMALEPATAQGRRPSRSSTCLSNLTTTSRGDFRTWRTTAFSPTDPYLPRSDLPTFLRSGGKLV